jgi:DnaJ homolog subfamily B member 12
VAADRPKREYTAAQAALVKRVKSCRVTAYYEILQLEKKCSEGDIKKAYKKVKPTHRQLVPVARTQT